MTDSRRRPEDRQRSPTPPENVSPKDRFKERTEAERLQRQEMHHSVPNQPQRQNVFETSRQHGTSKR